jgi:uncharacterized membrane protein
VTKLHLSKTSSCATEWSGAVSSTLEASTSNSADGINDAGQVVGFGVFVPQTIPESSTWAVILLVFAGLAFAGYRRSQRVLG